MLKFKIVLLIFILFLMQSYSFAQQEDSPLKIFGYFQTSFQHQKETISNHKPKEFSSFNLQQLNVFVQRDFSQNWTAFMNVEVVNNYSSSRMWGGLNLEEAWVRYRKSNFLNIKLGLQIPIFNNLNEIKNKTPLLPYIVRPLVYEASMSEAILSLKQEEYVPGRAFVQVYGFIPYKEFKVDYAFYLGNSTNISVVNENQLSGIDTSTTKLIGGRVGIRLGELKTGISATYDYVNFLQGMERYFGGSPTRFQHISRIRIGGDLSYRYKKFYLESEFIVVNYDDDIPEATIEKEFIYGTLGYYFTEKLFGYASYWFIHEEIFGGYEIGGETVIIRDINVNAKVPTVGVAYNLNDRITLKAQFAPVSNNFDKPIFESSKTKYFTIAASIFF